jgi:hypothetical protein
MIDNPYLIITPLEARALWLAYWRSVYGPIRGIMENEVEALHRTPLINNGFIQRVPHNYKFNNSRDGQIKMLEITYRGIQAKNYLNETGVANLTYPFITDPKHSRTDPMPLNDALEFINYERLNRGYPPMALVTLRHCVRGRLYADAKGKPLLKAHKVGREWMVYRADLYAVRFQLIKPVTYYSKMVRVRRVKSW